MARCLLVMLALGALVGCEQDYNLSDHPDVDPADVTECGFTDVEGTDARAYDCNPVLTTTGEAWANTLGSTAFAVTEVLGHDADRLDHVGRFAEVECDAGLGRTADTPVDRLDRRRISRVDIGGKWTGKR